LRSADVAGRGEAAAIGAGASAIGAEDVTGVGAAEALSSI
jgi:hypothetical protein